MKTPALSLALSLAALPLSAFSVLALPIAAQASAAHSASGPPTAPTPAMAPADERLGSVDFSESCAPAVHASFNRGIALLHDFWYDEAEPHSS